MRRLLVPLVFILLLAGGGFGAVMNAGWSPSLGLDLQGGAYVVLQPRTEVPDDVLEQSVEIIRSRVDAIGVAEPDISTQDDSIVVQLPGVRDRDRALEIVGQTAELRFRPVLGFLPPEDAPTETTTTTAPSDGAETEGGEAEGGTEGDEVAPAATTTTIPGTTPREEDTPEAVVVLPELDDAGNVEVRYQLGPAGASGQVVDTAQAIPPQGLEPEWSVSVELTREGRIGFNELAAQCFDRQPSCPTGQVAIVLDSVVRSAPTVQERTFPGAVSITGDFDEAEARDLATVLRFGSLPVELETLSIATVSATLGAESLRAGVAAGLLGLALVLVYMVVYYRALALVVGLGLSVSAMLLWSLISLLGETRGLALTLAGAVGIVVSIGVTVDSYIVFFERLKDELHAGRTLRSSVDRGFRRAFRTMVMADTSSLIGAGVLYLLTVGSVRGFALFLFIAGILDLFTAWFFTRPLVSILGRSRFFTEAPVFGLMHGLAGRKVREAVG